MSHKIYYDAPQPIEYLSPENIEHHKKNCPQLAAASIEELTLAPDQKTVQVTEEDGTTKQYQITPVIYPPEFITELEINDELRVRLNQTRQEHKRLSDLATQKLGAADAKITALTAKRDQWKNSGIATYKELNRTKDALYQLQIDDNFRKHVIENRNEELEYKKQKIRELKRDIKFKDHVIECRNKEIADLKQQVDDERAKAEEITEKFRELMRKRELNDEVRELRAQLRAEQKKTKELEAEIHKHDINQELGDLKRMLAHERCERARFEGTCTRLEREKEDLEQMQRELVRLIDGPK